MNRLVVSSQDSGRPGDEVGGRVELQLTEPLQARALRLVVRTQRTTAGSLFPRSLVEREAVIVGFPWEGHQVAIGLAVRKLLGITTENDLVWFPAGVTEWSFRFRLDPDWPQKDPNVAESVLTELYAYIDVPAASDLEARSPLHIVRSPAAESSR